MEKMPALPPKPPELIEIEDRRAAIRAERQVVEAELAHLETEAWDETQASVDPIDAAAERLAGGEADATSRTVAPEQIEVMRSRRDLLRRAEAKVAARVADGRAAHNRRFNSHRPGPGRLG